jgi:uncharacterized protein
LAILELMFVGTLGLISGLMIGCIGIGGVILVPALLFLADVPIRTGIPAAMAAYILSGIVATAVFARHKSIRWGMAAWLCAGAAPAAFAGAWVVSVVDARALEAFIGFLTFLSGLNSLRKPDTVDGSAATVSNNALLTIGTATGFLSSVSGTGGPLVLVPILMTLRLPVLTALGLSQALQLPVAIAATAGNVMYGRVDPILAGILAAALTIGSGGGAQLAHVVPRLLLRRIVSAVLVLIGAVLLANVGWRLSH